VKNVLNQTEIEKGKKLMWEWFEGLQTGIDRKDTSTWGNENWPDRHNSGIAFTNGAGQSDFQWFSRTCPNVRKVFELVWNTKELITSFDGFSVFRPWHKNKEWQTSESWLHVDQNPQTQLDRISIQASVNYFDQNESTGGFHCIPDSHKHFADIGRVIPKNIRSHQTHLKNIPKFHPVHNMETKLVQCYAGDMILWDSRTMHANTHARAPKGNNELLRLASFVCMVPTPKLEYSFLKVREQAVFDHLTGNHKAWETKWDGYFEKGEYVIKGHHKASKRLQRGLKHLAVSKRKYPLPDGSHELIFGLIPETQI